MSRGYDLDLVLAAVLVLAAGCAVAGLHGIRLRRSAGRRAMRLFGRPAEDAPLSRLGARARRCAGSPGVSEAAGAGVLSFAVLGGVLGAVVAAAVGYAVWRRRRARPAARAAAVAARQVLDQLPLAADLLAACLAAGAAPRAAAEETGGSLGGPLGERLAQAAAELRLGGDPATAWGRLAELPGARGLALCLERAHETGVPAVEPMSRLAGRLRSAQARAAGIRARRAGVLATAPLGLCFLPAFLTVGVVPMVIGLAGGLRP
ncbi:type II secretion system F family protein [Streptomyces orinoci]|uniref:Type II secretion system F family protein n=1 Tax=Streptomyces orinoci TaxID=67339 RepID=A0ABV3JY73_STRON|nr:type II secretion system F family protein [Streptomyces orinoci]